MAYAYSRLFSAMGKEPQKSDIFGGGAPQGNEAQNGLSLTGGGGAVGSGGGSSAPSSGAQPVRDTAVSSPSGAANQSQIFSQNQQATPGFVGNVKSGVDTAKSALDKEVQTYSSQQPQADTTDYRDLASRISNPQNSMASKFAGDRAKEKLRESIGATAAKPKDFESEVDTSFTDVDRLGSVGGLADLYQKGSAGGEYSSKLAKFDAAKLSGEKDFQNTRKAIQEGAKGVREQQENLTGPGDSEIEANQKALFENAQSQKMAAIREALVGAQGDVRSGLDSAAARQNAVKVNPDTAAYHKQALEQLAAENPEYARHLSSQANPLDMKQYWQGPANMSGADVATADDVSRFSNINELLSQAGGDPRDTLAVGGGRESGKFDIESYKNKLRDFGDESIGKVTEAKKKDSAEASKAAVKKASKSTSVKDLIKSRHFLRV